MSPPKQRISLLAAGFLTLTAMLVSCSEAPSSSTPVTVDDGGGARFKASIEYSSYIGGNGEDEAREPVVLSDGRLVLGLRTWSTDLQTTAGAFQRSFGGGEGDTYVAILSANGAFLSAASYFGGTGEERSTYGTGIASNGDIVFTSGTNSTDLPTTPGAYLSSLNSPPSGGYVCRFPDDLTVPVWCTYIAGWPRGGLALDSNDNVYVVGNIQDRSDFKPTSGAYQTTVSGPNDVYVLRLSSDGSTAIFETALGGSSSSNGEVGLNAHIEPGAVVITGIALSSDWPVTASAPQRVHAGKRDAFFARLSLDGSTLLYSTLLGGSAEDFAEHGMQVMADGSIILAGVTQSDDLPGATGSLNGESDGFVAKLAGDGTAFSFVRYIGGSDKEPVILGSATDAEGNIYVVGQTSSRDFPVTAGAFQPTYGGGPTDGVLAVLSPDGSRLLFSSFLGGSGDEIIRGIAFDRNGAAYIVGRTSSDDFPVTTGAFQTRRAQGHDGFAVKLSIAAD